LATLQSLAVAGFAHSNYRMPGRAWSLLRALPAAFFFGDSTHPAAVYGLISIQFRLFCQAIFANFRIFRFSSSSH
jgi:hypothetical protein